MAVKWRIKLLSMVQRQLGTAADMSLEDIRSSRESHIPSHLPLPEPVRTRLEHLLFGTPRRDVDIDTSSVAGADGDLPVRIYRAPNTGSDAPLIVYFHGGGWTIGSPQQYDWLCTSLAEDVGAVVVSVDYRKAPEHPAPAAAEDALASFAWIDDHRDAFGAHGPVAVAGDSAGGNLAALVAITARDDGRELAAQILVYPGVDLTASFPSIREKRDAPILSKRDIDAFLKHYLAGEHAGDEPAISPWFVDDLSGLAPALVQTAAEDPLIDEGEAYARRLADAGVEVRYTRYVDVPHGFLSLAGIEPAARQAAAEITDFLRSRLPDTVRSSARSVSPEGTE